MMSLVLFVLGVLLAATEGRGYGKTVMSKFLKNIQYLINKSYILQLI